MNFGSCMRKKTVNIVLLILNCVDPFELPVPQNYTKLSPTDALVFSSHHIYSTPRIPS